jgi:hypothetical protein
MPIVFFLSLTRSLSCGSMIYGLDGSLFYRCCVLCCVPFDSSPIVCVCVLFLLLESIIYENILLKQLAHIHACFSIQHIVFVKWNNDECGVESDERGE